MRKVVKICFLASGGGGNFKFLYLAQELKIIKNIELFVVADRQCNSINFSTKEGIYSKEIIYNKNNNKELLYELEKINPDIVVTNWHKIIDKEVVDKYCGKLINLHYSLLPAFAGLIGTKPLEEAYSRGCKYVGATCHYINKCVDSGKIISQTIVKTDITIERAVPKVFKKGCLILLNSILIVSNNKNIIFLKENQSIGFSPSLQFDDRVFDYDFWEQLSLL